MRRVVMVACAMLLLVPVYLKSRTCQDSPTRTAFCALSSGRISVQVSGDVMHPGVYEVPANSMALDVIKMAEPLSPQKRYKIDSDSAFNSLLHNGSALKLTAQSDGIQLVAEAQMAVSERLVLSIPLEIATMTEADFDRLPGIGPALAQRIVGYRQNNGGILRVEDLPSVEGIGEKKYAVLRNYFQTTVNKR